MMAENTGGQERVARTPGWAVRALLPYLPPEREGMVVVDAGAGDGAIADVLTTRGKYRNVICVETNPVHCEALRASGEWDVREETWKQFTTATLRVDLVVSNPPFSDAMDFVHRGLCVTGAGVHLNKNVVAAFLLRLPWLASQSRAAFHRANPAHILVLPRRPEFCMSCSCGQKPKCKWSEIRPIDAERPKACGGCGGKAQVSTSDATDYAWFVWGTTTPASGAPKQLVPGRWDVLEVEER